MTDKTNESAEAKAAREKAAEDRAAERRLKKAFADIKLGPESRYVLDAKDNPMRYVLDAKDNPMLQVANKVLKKAALRKVN
jgi:hypothetical protein